MTDFPSVPNKISHKDLNSLLRAAFKDTELAESSLIDGTNKLDEFNQLLRDWAERSEKILKLLEEKDPRILKKIKSRQVMALGALQAHLTMALQAKYVVDQDT